MKELNDLVTKAITRLHEEGIIEQKINKQLDKTISSIISDLFRSYSDFGKELETALKESLNINLDMIGLHEYNDLILKAIKSMVDEKINTIGLEVIEKDIEKFLTNDIPAEVKLSEIIEKFKEDKFNFQDPGEYEISFHIESDILHFIRFDEDAGKSTYQCQYNLAIDVKEGNLRSVEISGKDMTKGLFLGGLYGFDGFLFKLYVGKTNIIVDEGAIDTYYSSYDD